MSQGFEFTVYSLEFILFHGSYKGEGIWVETIRNDSKISKKVKERLLRIPNLIELKIYDRTYLKRFPISGINTDHPKRRIWFVRYKVRPIHGIGPTMIMIIDDKTAEVIYDVSYGGE